MNDGTTFRIFAKDLTKGGLVASDAVRRMAINYAVCEYRFCLQSPENAEKGIADGKIPRYFPVYQPKPKGDIGENFVRDPFANWVDTTDNRICREIASYDFSSDFNELHEHYGLDACSWNDNIEISRSGVEKILAVVDYILAGEYSAKVESAVFRDNPFLRVFERQFLSFADRFRKPKANRRNGDECDDEMEMGEIRRKDIQCCRRIRDVFAGFLQMSDSARQTVNSKYISYHLAYFKW